jgi:hypothetical protein
MSTRKSKRNDWLAREKPNQTKGASGHASEKQDRPASPSPEPIMPREEQHHPKTDGRSNNANHDKKHWLEYATGAFAFIAAAGGIFAASFGGWQASVASDSEKRQLRAYIGLVPGGIDNFGDVQKQHFFFTRRNYGQSPAYDVVLTELGQSILVNGQPLPLPLELKPPPEILRGNVTLFPTAELPMNIFGAAFPKEQLDRVNADTNLRFIYPEQLSTETPLTISTLPTSVGCIKKTV